MVQSTPQTKRLRGIPTLDLAALEQVRARLVGRILRTPALPSPTLSELTGADVVLKAESLQMTGSFKLRGATNKLLELSSQGVGGVIAASAGNHARAVAHAARTLKMACTVVMPRWASPQKVRNTERLGARVLLVGDSLEAATEHARKVAVSEDLAFVHPYDDWDVIAGQATLGLEILDDVPDADLVVVPVGGGGLAAGILAALRATRSTTRAIGVRAAPGATLPDGIRVKAPGGRPLTLLRYLAETVEVDDSAVARAMTLLLEEHALLAEGAGAAATAALISDALRPRRGEHVVVLLSGGNVDLALLERAVDFGLAASGRLARLSVRIPDRSGALADRLERIGRLGGNIRQIEHERGEVGLPPGITVAIVTVEARGPEHLREIAQAADGGCLPCPETGKTEKKRRAFAVRDGASSNHDM